MQVLQVQLNVGADPAEVGRARRWARSRLAGSGIQDGEPVAETLILLISELVTNAVVHTGAPAVLRMLFGSGEAEAGTVRVEVADASTRPPKPRQARDAETNGRGLELVEGLADRWGWQPEGAGKRIWCEVDRCAPAPKSATASASGSASVPGATPAHESRACVRTQLVDTFCRRHPSAPARNVRR
ncbi:ATP-binding protein [Streptomyces sp. NPDC088725]|uniref:ATP-binding protein n=1 Tax=Streptomyces sp. NPDC088725 TaxID=3365873 RepID=UPI003820D315